MPVPLEQFVKQLSDSGVMSADDIQAFHASLPAERLNADDAQSFARELVRQRKLTAFQASAVYQGKGQGLVFGNYVVHDKLGQGGMGTVDYMSPEQALHTKRADRPADIYSLGCSLCYLLTGTPVYGGESLMERLLAHREQPIPSLAAVRSEVPPAVDAVFHRVDAVFHRMVGKKPEDRYASMKEVIRDLEACLAGGDVSASASFPGLVLSRAISTAGSGTMGSEDPDEQDFLKAISPAASATDVRTKVGLAAAPDTMVSRVELSSKPAATEP